MFNGKRTVAANAGTNSGEYAVDVGNFPNIAMQRIELLKNGGSTTYGTDAMAGVFNFITRDEFEGAEFRIAHADIINSDGDDEFGMIFVINTGNVNWVASLAWQERPQLLIVDANQAGVNSRRYQPGPYVAAEHKLNHFVDWYLQQLR